jgi:hypothetical protein
VLKVILIASSILILASCVSQDAKHQAASQPTPGVEPDVSADVDQVVGQSIYVPIYSHIYTQDKSRTINLAATLSIRPSRFVWHRWLPPTLLSSRTTRVVARAPTSLSSGALRSR